tara:strand:- start:582 stop:752 length:171 start_codon:yes stop_codon:yes gene_type:complete
LRYFDETFSSEEMTFCGIEAWGKEAFASNIVDDSGVIPRFILEPTGYDFFAVRTQS